MIAQVRQQGIPNGAVVHVTDKEGVDHNRKLIAYMTATAGGVRTPADFQLN